MILKKYGSYSREQFAYFFVYEAVKIRKKEEVKEFIFAAVPVQVAAMVAFDSNALTEFAKKDAEAREIKFLRIIREKVYKYQLIEVNGERLYITGLKSVRNARQIALSREMTTVFLNVIKDKDVTEDELKSLFEEIVQRYRLCANRLGNQLKIFSLSDSFNSADSESRKRALVSLVAIANAATNMIDLSGISGGKTVGNMQPNISQEMSNSKNHFAFIDQSVTGMFERKTYL